MNKKILLAAFLIAVVLLLVYYLEQKKKIAAAKAKENEPPPCKVISHLEWSIMVKERKNVIAAAELTKLADTSLPMVERWAYHEKYKIEAYSKSIRDYPWLVIDYGAGIDAAKQMITVGYCKP